MNQDLEIQTATSPDSMANWLESLRREKEEFASLPPNAMAGPVASQIIQFLIPGFQSLCTSTQSFDDDWKEIQAQVALGLSCLNADHAVQPFLQHFPKLKRLMESDLMAAFERDPAAKSLEEVKMAYLGFDAIAHYRIAHELHILDVPLIPRVISSHAHRQTGIDIHPAARIGQAFFIDHGSGVVIGESAIIGKGVTIYQGVTLGALQVRKELAMTKRHPTIEDDVVIYSNATILGGDTIIGKGSVIGANAWVTESIPSQSFVGRNNEVRPLAPSYVRPASRTRKPEKL